MLAWPVQESRSERGKAIITPIRQLLSVQHPNYPTEILTSFLQFFFANFRCLPAFQDIRTFQRHRNVVANLSNLSALKNARSSESSPSHHLISFSQLTAVIRLSTPFSHFCLLFQFFFANFLYLPALQGTRTYQKHRILEVRQRSRSVLTHPPGAYNLETGAFSLASNWSVSVTY